MKLTFFCNYLNHHQVELADELYKLLGDDYRFVVTRPTDPTLMKGGVDYSHERLYAIACYETDALLKNARQLAITSDVCVFGGESMPFAILRAKINPKGLSFEQGERWLKRGLINILSPHLLKWWIVYQLYYRRAKFYYLCSSAFGARDLHNLGTYSGRTFKWGYFTHVDEDFELEASKQDASSLVSTPIIWCARFLSLKHPELPIKMAKKLKDEQFKFKIDMYGDGEIWHKMKQLADKLNVNDVVFFHGNKPNNQILKEMRKHDIFLFTSDKKEGWGAVANEAMSNGCVMVGSNSIGSVPYLIPNKEIGLVFDSENLESLTDKVKWLLMHPEKCMSMRKRSLMQMREVWSPTNAANNLITLCKGLSYGNNDVIGKGPCSIAD